MEERITARDEAQRGRRRVLPLAVVLALGAMLIVVGWLTRDRVVGGSAPPGAGAV
jgi:hypothetical protein